MLMTMAQRPLAERVRPTSIEDIAGVEQLPPQLLRALNNGLSTSMILVGPPGVGKTTLARIIAARTEGVAVEELSAVHAGKAELDKLRKRHEGTQLVLVLDEIHRWNKAQQDALLGPVERGEVLLIGATTETPYVALQRALLSRCEVIYIQPLSEEDLTGVLMDAARRESGSIAPGAALQLARAAEGDARRALRILDALLVEAAGEPIGELPASIQLEAGRAIGAGMRADYVSAWIKSMRATDPDAAVWYLAHLLHSQEDAVFLARRLMIFASEDVGLAQSALLNVCTAAAQSVQLVGMPEARIILSHACLACATAPKSNSAFVAISRALADVASNTPEQPPIDLRDAHHPGAKAEGAGRGYRYPPDHGGYVAGQRLPAQAAKRITPGSLWAPVRSGAEAKLAERMRALRQDPS
jgi:putative ATPase